MKAITNTTEEQKRQHLRFPKEPGSDYGYLLNSNPNGTIRQINILHQLFPGLSNANEKLAEAKLPPNAEGWFAFPRWQKIAPTYNEAVQKVLDLIKRTRNGKFYNYREGQLGPKYLRQSQESAKAWEKLGQEQKDHDILIVPAQFGRRTRAVTNQSEFGLGTFAIGIMILTHPDRFINDSDFYIYCAGDEVPTSTTSALRESPCFLFNGAKIEFGTCLTCEGDNHGGSAYGFVS